MVRVRLVTIAHRIATPCYTSDQLNITFLARVTTKSTWSSNTCKLSFVLFNIADSYCVVLNDFKCYLVIYMENI